MVVSLFLQVVGDDGYLWVMVGGGGWWCVMVGCGTVDNNPIKMYIYIYIFNFKKEDEKDQKKKKERKEHICENLTG